jgi:hypothetical protein
MANCMAYMISGFLSDGECKDLKQQHSPGFVTPAIFAYGLHKRLYISSVSNQMLEGEEAEPQEQETVHIQHRKKMELLFLS